MSQLYAMDSTRVSAMVLSSATHIPSMHLCYCHGWYHRYFLIGYLSAKFSLAEWLFFVCHLPSESRNWWRCSKTLVIMPRSLCSTTLVPWVQLCSTTLVPWVQLCSTTLVPWVQLCSTTLVPWVQFTPLHWFHEYRYCSTTLVPWVQVLLHYTGSMSTCIAPLHWFHEYR